MSYYISPRFLDKVAVHITKNFLDLPGVRVPLILGIHGHKGEGKSFQCELIFQQMGIEAIQMSAGELESPDAGDPARLIRLRYREAAELIKVRGKMCVLKIDDLDAGAGRFDKGTQYTVNTQLVNGTLMNIADRPTDVQLPGSYDATPLHRVPIIVTGNDFSTLYAPLIRDGRMEKFYWEPNREEKIGIVGGIFEPDKLSPREIEQLVDTFSDRPVDFFSALRSRLYDEQIRQFIDRVGLERVSMRVVNSSDRLPEFKPPDFSLSHLIEFGNSMVQEQEQVYRSRLVEQYNPIRFSISSEDTNAERQSNFENQPSPQPNGHSSPTPPLNREVGRNRREDGRSRESIEWGEVTPGNAKPTFDRLSSEGLQQLQDILQNGYRLALEYADDRHFRMGAWKTYPTISANQAPEVIAEVESFLAERPNDYVRLIAIDPKAKRRVIEKVIQRPGSVTKQNK
ncbi:MAG: ribulose bisphosphate carboxylase small subunit [Cyanosarcina radialis HA8281-LM2]|jgi:ribulose bisphosphate carboxylase small subunit|nr:ribulose bisphosphate carboxylase small subunit [Cyanosarcina radialis HA8281-LM2]